MKKMTIAEIAKLAGCNSSTVSRALNPATASLISAPCREKIIRLCDRLNYRPRITARGCATGKTYTIGFISCQLAYDLSSPFLGTYLAAIGEELQNRGYALTLISVPGVDQRLQSSVRDILLSERADGYILGAGLLKKQTQDMFRFTGRPIVTHAYHNMPRVGGFPAVEINIDHAVAEAWKNVPDRLLKKKICFFGHEDSSADSKLAKIREYAPRGIKVDVQHIPEFSRYLAVNHAEAVRASELLWPQLSQYALVWCASDMAAMGVMDTMRRHGMEPGREINLISYDHLSVLIPNFPDDFATIDPCWHDAGTAIAQKVLEFIESPDKRRLSVKIDARFIPGKSLACEKKTAENDFSE